MARIPSTVSIQTTTRALRKALVERGVAPEDLPAAEDIKRVKRRAKDDERQIEDRGFDEGRGVD
jgi:DNA-damage-inducible protein D